MDRVDIRVSLPLLEFNLLPAGDTSADMRLTVQRARRRREVRTSGRRHVRNADLSVHAPRDLLNMQRSAQVTYAKACGSLRLSGRASAAVARVARTIADVEDSDEIVEDHVLEAIAHRRRGEDSPLWSVG